jgi:hypothetical protein
MADCPFASPLHHWKARVARGGPVPVPEEAQRLKCTAAASQSSMSSPSCLVAGKQAAGKQQASSRQAVHSATNQPASQQQTNKQAGLDADALAEPAPTLWPGIGPLALALVCPWSARLDWCCTSRLRPRPHSRPQRPLSMPVCA